MVGRDGLVWHIKVPQAFPIREFQCLSYFLFYRNRTREGLCCVPLPRILHEFVELCSSGCELTLLGGKCSFGLEEKQPDYGAGREACELQGRGSRKGSNGDLNGRDMLIFARKDPYSNQKRDGYFMCKMLGIKNKVSLSRIS